MPIYKVDGKQKDGKQAYRVRVNYTDAMGNARQLTRMAYGIQDAKKMERQLAEKESHTAPATVDEMFSMYCESIKNDIRTSTMEKKIRTYNMWIKDFCGARKIDYLTRRNLQLWKNMVNDSDLNTRSKQNLYSEFRALLNFGVKMELISENNITKIGNFRDTEFRSKTEKFRYYTSEDFEKFISCADDYKYLVFFSIAYLTGMRKGEINALRWEDVDGDVIHVRRSVCQKTKGNYTETPPKNITSVRDIQMPKVLIAILAEQRERQSRDAEFSEHYHVCGGYGYLSDTSLQNKNIQFANAAGLPHIRIHDFRHSHVTLLANNNINIQEVARRLGHSDIKMTWNTYSHLYPKEQERALDVLSKIDIKCDSCL